MFVKAASKSSFCAASAASALTRADMSSYVMIQPPSPNVA
jgi:hypothetical protein